jgi:Glycosyl hydrolase family 99
MLLMLFVIGVPAILLAGPKPVMVHYMPWFVSQPFSGSWGFHWTMNHFNPNVINTNGEREIASWYYPAIGPYDSDDPAVLEYHVLLMKLAGINGVIVDWYGMDNFNDYAINNQRTLALFNYIRKAGLKFSLCYEDSTIQQEVNGGFITASGAIAHAQQTLLYAQTNFFTNACFLRLSNAPVLLNFGPQYFHNDSDWSNIFSVLAASNRPAFFTEDNRLSVGEGAFDWPPMWMSQTNGGVLSDAMLQSYLSAFEQKAQTAPAWPAFISTAFPRFHDIYQQAGVEPSYGYLDDQNGHTFRETLSRAMTNHSAIVQIATWNDFGEGTIIEPTREFGYRDLGVIQDFRRQYLDASFPYHTNDLALATRLYNLREKYKNSNSIVSAELDRVFTNIISGNLTAATLQLHAMESNVPAIYDLSFNSGELRFSIGGYLSSNGIEIQTASNLSPAAWQTVNAISVGTNLITFETNISAQAKTTFFRIKNDGL